jgi:hypothetical protein
VFGGRGPGCQRDHTGTTSPLCDPVIFAGVWGKIFLAYIFVEKGPFPPLEELRGDSDFPAQGDAAIAHAATADR